MVGDPGSPPVTTDDDYLAGVAPVSVPMAISEHLSQVQLAVRSIVGKTSSPVRRSPTTPATTA